MSDRTNMTGEEPTQTDNANKSRASRLPQIITQTLLLVSMAVAVTTVGCLMSHPAASHSDADTNLVRRTVRSLTLPLSTGLLSITVLMSFHSAIRARPRHWVAFGIFAICRFAS